MTDSNAPCFTYDLNLALPSLPIFQINPPSFSLPLPNLSVGGAVAIPCCKFDFSINLVLPTLGFSLFAVLLPINVSIFALETTYNAVAASFGLSLGVAIPTCGQLADEVL